MLIAQSATIEYQLQMQGDSGNQEFRIRVDAAGGNGITDSVTQPVAEQWYHVAWTYDGSDTKIFVDSIGESTNSESSGSGNINDNGLATGIGARNNGTVPSDGTIDDFVSTTGL